MLASLKFTGDSNAVVLSNICPILFTLLVSQSEKFPSFSLVAFVNILSIFVTLLVFIISTFSTRAPSNIRFISFTFPAFPILTLGTFEFQNMNAISSTLLASLKFTGDSNAVVLWNIALIVVTLLVSQSEKFPSLSLDAPANMFSIFVTLLVFIPFGKTIFSVWTPSKKRDASSENCTPEVNSILLIESTVSFRVFLIWNHLSRSILPFPWTVKVCAVWSHTPCTAPRSKVWLGTETASAKSVEGTITPDRNTPNSTNKYFFKFFIAFS